MTRKKLETSTVDKSFSPGEVGSGLLCRHPLLPPGSRGKVFPPFEDWVL